MELPSVVQQYFQNLTAGRFVEAAASFTADGFYSHEAYDPGAIGPTGARLEARGRDAIAAMFRLRAERDWHHEIDSDVVGSSFYIHGRALDRDDALVLSFLSVGTISADGRISSYIEYDTRPPVGFAAAVQVEPDLTVPRDER
ncbi:nuclear transport factor 2 family protein [Cryobacterium sp. Y62]|uniref:nuclear transport factor 2 family protein n=1 Tax=Cryobacterium sp. Y62 TaxID=2048284 RepID=UPI000CE381CF|nr:nuclear transport factor 2 family protein [Cryobacterium sp. Y62]